VESIICETYFQKGSIDQELETYSCKNDLSRLRGYFIKQEYFNKWCWENWTATCKRMKLDHFLTSYTEIHSRWSKDLHIRPETIKILEESTDNNFSHIGHNNILLDRSPEVRETKAKVNYWDYLLKVTINQTKRQPPEWKNMFAKDIPDKGLISIHIKNLHNSIPPPQNLFI